MACNDGGCGSPCPPCPQQAFVHTLDPDCPVSVAGDSAFDDILTLDITVPGGLPAFGISVVADLTIVNENESDADVIYRIVDVAADGFTTTVLRSKTFEIAGGDDAGEDFAIIGGLNNLSAGVHSIRLQVSSAAAAVEVTEAGMLVTMYRQTFFAVTESVCDVG